MKPLASGYLVLTELDKKFRKKTKERMRLMTDKSDQYKEFAVEQRCRKDGTDPKNYYLDVTGMRYKNGSLIEDLFTFCTQLPIEDKGEYLTELSKLIKVDPPGIVAMVHLIQQENYTMLNITRDMILIHDASLDRRLEAYWRSHSGQS